MGALKLVQDLRETARGGSPLVVDADAAATLLAALELHRGAAEVDAAFARERCQTRGEHCVLPVVDAPRYVNPARLFLTCPFCDRIWELYGNVGLHEVTPSSTSLAAARKNAGLGDPS